MDHKNPGSQWKVMIIRVWCHKVINHMTQSHTLESRTIYPEGGSEGVMSKEPYASSVGSIIWETPSAHISVLQFTLTFTVALNLFYNPFKSLLGFFPQYSCLTQIYILKKKFTYLIGSQLYLQRWAQCLEVLIKYSWVMKLMTIRGLHEKK